MRALQSHLKKKDSFHNIKATENVFIYLKLLKLLEIPIGYPLRNPPLWQKIVKCSAAPNLKWIDKNVPYPCIENPFFYLQVVIL